MFKHRLRSKAVVLKLGYVYPWGYVKVLHEICKKYI